MIVDDEGLTGALTRLKRDGGDCLDIEAKTFSSYSPKALGPTLSAFANLPGGGTILLGVSESPLRVVGVDDPAAMMKSLVAQARQGFPTAITVDTRSIRVDGHEVVVANVFEVPTNAKPCRWNETKAAYLRQYDGDYRLSPQEEQQFLLRHTRPRNDSVEVAGTSQADLAPDLVPQFLRAARSGSTALRGESDDGILSRLNILTEHGTLTLAGLYALGSYPQKQFPSLAITAAVLPDDGDRAQDRLSITGPVPQMLREAVEWVERVTTSRIVFSADGHGRDAHEYPMVAVRELIANALIHRDLSEPALSKSIELRLLPDRLVISSPGGLWGLSVDQLGTRDGKSAVNEYLYTIATFTSDDEGHRVIEGLGTGIRAAQQAVRDAHLAPLRFLDTGVRFTSLLPRTTLTDAALNPQAPERAAEPAPSSPVTDGIGDEEVPAEVGALTHNASAVWRALGGGAVTRSTIAGVTGLNNRQVSYALRLLVEHGFVEIIGGRGDTFTTYRRR